jgi:hypothetical protein
MTYFGWRSQKKPTYRKVKTEANFRQELFIWSSGVSIHQSANLRSTESYNLYINVKIRGKRISSRGRVVGLGLCIQGCGSQKK